MECARTLLDDVARHGWLVCRYHAVQRRSKGVDVGPSAEVLQLLVNLLTRSVTRCIAHRRASGAAASQHLLACAEVNQSRHVVLHQDVGRLDVEVEKALAVHLVQRVEHMEEIKHRFLFVQWLVGAAKTVANALSVDEIHHVVVRAVLFKHIMDAHNMLVAEFAQAISLLAELIELLIELFYARGHSNLNHIVMATRVYAPHVELLNSYGLVKLVDSDVGVAETSARQITHNSIGSAKNCVHAKHRAFIYLVGFHPVYYCLVSFS